MPDILADYRSWRDQQAARVSTHSAGCHMWHERCMIDRLADALERARLTDEELEAIANGASSLEAEAMREGLSIDATAYMRKHAATLRGLLARLS